MCVSAPNSSCAPMHMLDTQLVRSNDDRLPTDLTQNCSHTKVYDYEGTERKTQCSNLQPALHGAPHSTHCHHWPQQVHSACYLHSHHSTQAAYLLSLHSKPCCDNRAELNCSHELRKSFTLFFTGLCVIHLHSIAVGLATTGMTRASGVCVISMWPHTELILPLKKN